MSVPVLPGFQLGQVGNACSAVCPGEGTEGSASGGEAVQEGQLVPKK